MIVDCEIYNCVHNLYQKYLNVKGVDTFKERKYLSDLKHVTILLELIDLGLDCNPDNDANITMYASELELIAQCGNCCVEEELVVTE